MFRKTLGLVLAILVCSPAAQAVELVRKEVLAGKVSLMLPPSFDLMAEDLRKLKYPGDNPPIVFTDAGRTVNVVINHSSIKITEAQMPSAKAALETSLKGQYANATWLKSEAITTKTRTVLRYDFRAPATDTTIRNIMYGASVGGTLLLITFTCSMADEADWADTGKAILDSIEIRK